MQQSLRITEIFYSLQGESNTVGLPTVFIRLTGCPLRCVYCDTAYAFKGGQRMYFDEIFQKIAAFNPRYITVTGGEPLAQPNCSTLLSMLCDQGYHVSLETSGAISVANLDSRVIKVMDLKTPSSGELDKNLFENIDYVTPKDQIKFVIGDQQDYDWSKSIIKQYNLSHKAHLLFSPIHDRMPATELADWIIRDNLPVRFQIQLHKYLWANEPGR